ncbi:helix-turn-helix domain-containing protein [Nocardia sp. NPDC052566]|uniref:MmyB family transcriptional regulator n=1 Tax=Nocardia sp. NPDC052566 TaxID=3364330 RepID=UPI0037C8B94F
MRENPGTGASAEPHRLLRRQQARVPTLPEYLKQVRVQQKPKLSRRNAESKTGVSEHYIRDIETGQRQPSAHTIEQLIAGYQLIPPQARHVRELLAPPIDLTPTETLHSQVHRSQGLLDHMSILEDRGVLAAYVDPLLNVLLLNKHMLRAYPRLDEVGNVAPWIFGPYSRGVLTDRANEADQVVALLKAVMGRHRNAPQTTHLLSRLRPNNDFNRIWTTRTRIAYGRETTDYLRWRDQITGERFAASIYSTDVEVPDVVLYLAFHKRDNDIRGDT